MSDHARRYELIIFDWDGTLASSVIAIANAVQAAAGQLDLPVPSITDICQGIGTTPHQQYLRLFGENCLVSSEVFLSCFRTHYFGQSSAATGLFPGVVEMLAELRAREFQLAIATGMSRVGLQRFLAESEIADYFVTTRTADDGPSKPSPAILQQILDELAVEPQAAVMVGDTSFDLAAASAAGMASIAVTTGVHNQAELMQHGPVAIIQDIVQLLDLV